jgi:hypothetical protein
MDKPFTAVVNGQPMTFERGTVVVPLHGRDTPTEGLDPDVVHRLVREAAERDHTVFYSVSTGLTPEGPDLGGESSDVLEKPSVALLVGNGMSSTLAGEAWHLLSERFEIPVSLIDGESLARFDLSRYNVVVHPGGSLPDASSEALKSWIRSGGRVVLFSGAVGWARSEGLLDLTPKSFEMDSLVADLAYDQIRLARDAQSIGGSIFKMSLDTSHPLAYGMPEGLPVFHTGTQFYDLPASAGTAFGVYEEDPVLSGYISDERLELLRKSTAAVAERYGRGRVVAFMDRLSFRAYWYGTQRLFMNAVLLSGSY